MSERDTILGRIREALREPGPQPGARDAEATGGPSAPTPDVRDVLPAVGAAFDERLALFERNARELKAEFHLLTSPAALPARVKELAAAEGWKTVGTHAGALTDPVCLALGLPAVRTEATYDAGALEACDAGISECDALIAQTGSVLVTSRSAGGRALSILPPHHVVLARREQLVAGLPDAFALLKTRFGSDYPSMISFITGPSRTGDIERILVLGAHGPKRLTILCV